MTDQGIREVLEVLSFDSRWNILQHLSHAGGDIPSKIANTLGMNATTTSFHLGAMEKAGLVKRTKVARFALYTIIPSILDSVILRLTELRKALPDETKRDQNLSTQALDVRTIRDGENSSDSHVG